MPTLNPRHADPKPADPNQSSVAQQYDVVIIGAGLAGLTTAVVCRESGLDVCVLEAQSRIGGRVHSLYAQSGDALINNTHVADLGPTWVWAKYQPHVQRWLQALEINLMPQFERGQGMLDRDQNQHAEPWPLPGQDGMTRINGGPQSIINALCARLPSGTVHTNCPVSAISAEHKQLKITADSCEVLARHVVVATPLPIAAQSIKFSPALPEAMTQQMQNTATWMAQQAKVVIQYADAFWRERGLSGRIASQIGPLVEAHDHSADKGTPAALFGFMGVPYSVREQHRQELPSAISTQLVRVFGESAPEPQHIHIEDWANNAWICSRDEQTGGGQHPSVLAKITREAFMQDRLHFAVSETSTISPGLIEGALHAGESTAQRIIKGSQ